MIEILVAMHADGMAHAYINGAEVPACGSAVERAEIPCSDDSDVCEDCDAAARAVAHAAEHGPS